MQKVESLSSKRIKLTFTINTTVSIYAMYTMHINLTPKGIYTKLNVLHQYIRLIYWCKTLNLVYIPFGVRFMCIVYIAYMDTVVLIVKINFIRFEDKLSIFACCVYAYCTPIRKAYVSV